MDYIVSTELVPIFEPLISFESSREALYALQREGIFFFFFIIFNHDINNSCVVLIMLDLSAAFDVIDHPILLKRLEHAYGISGSALLWFHSYLSNSEYQPIRLLRSDPAKLLNVPRTKTKTYGEKRFDKCAANLWNSLPVEIKHIDSLTVFKKAIKTHLFKLAYQ
ncbi:hypothetical protein MAR_007357 [Mya arenaria]|uniref:Reverse transcriptase domain-containing protein n=1 Tax=Mya arenaria TaxID=6604 RepID=A0ABY7DCW0_MYAAR|nr:hypothetical protein MAR_007357 [Mya arenaria]